MKIQILAIMLLFAATGLKAQQTDFSGTWTRNTAKCDAGGLSINSIPISLSIKQNSGQIEVRRMSKNYKGDTTTYTENLYFDGSPDTTMIKSNVNKKATISWSDDKKDLTEIAVYADDQGGIFQHSRESWSLSTDNKMLTIKSTLTVNSQDHVLTEVFDRQ